MPDIIGGLTSPLAPDESYPQYWRNVWGAAVTGLNPDTAAFANYTSAIDEGMRAISIFSRSSDNWDGDPNPHVGKEFTPLTTELNDMGGRIADIEMLVNFLFWDEGEGEWDIPGYYNEAVANAVTQYATLGMNTLNVIGDFPGDLEDIADAYDLHVATSADVDALVDAIDEASKRHYLRDLARVTAGMLDVRAVQGTQLPFIAANMENIRASEAAEAEARLRTAALRDKGAHVSQMAGQVLDAKMQFALRDNQTKSALVLEMINAQLMQGGGVLSVLNSLAQLQNQYSIYNLTVNQDKIVWELEQAVRDRLWDWEMFSYFQQAVGMHGNAIPLPRAQTLGERVAGAAMTGLSTGLTTGAMFGNPMIGLATGLGGFALQMLATPWAR